MAAFAVAGDAGQWVAWGVLAAVLAAKARREERDLVRLHPGYEAYRAQTRAIIPFLF
jgi:protein-S-isoprenylcysteine O-methyltransferase Ste14